MGKFVDLTNEKYGRLTIVKRVENQFYKGGQRAAWLCVCDCGNKIIVSSNSLKMGNTKSCGCLQKEKHSESVLIDLVGKRFGRLVVLRRAENIISPNGQPIPMWECLCDCGTKKIIRGSSLRTGNTSSCGCFEIENRINNMALYRYSPLRHGESKSKLYSVWRYMKSRCTNPNACRYDRYGARGIKVCDEWFNSYEVFRNWALLNGYKEGLSIDRIDVNGDYTPENCRWATMKEQNLNKCNTVFVEYEGETLPLVELVENLGLNYNTVCSRLYRQNMSIEDAVTKPLIHEGYRSKAKSVASGGEYCGK